MDRRLNVGGLFVIVLLHLMNLINIQCIEVNKLAKIIDMSPRWIKEQIKSGKLLGYRLGNRIVVNCQSVSDFMASREMRIAEFAAKGRAKVLRQRDTGSKNLPSP